MLSTKLMRHLLVCAVNEQSVHVSINISLPTTKRVHNERISCFSLQKAVSTWVASHQCHKPNGRQTRDDWPTRFGQLSDIRRHNLIVDACSKKIMLSNFYS